MEASRSEVELGAQLSMIDDEIYEFARLHAGQHTMADLANIAADRSGGRFTPEEALSSVRSQMGSSLDLTASRTVAIGGPSPAEMRDY